MSDSIPEQTLPSERPKDVAALVILAFIGSLFLVMIPQSSEAVTVPPYGVSRYIQTNDPNKLYDYGCSMGNTDLGRSGTQNTKVVLDFGGPWKNSSGTQGATLFGGPNSTISQIIAAAKEYAHGYWLCTGSDTSSHAEVFIGTNNSTGTTYVTSAHGGAWAKMARDLNAWVANQAYGTQVSFAAGNDIEPGFGIQTAARNWGTGYNNYWLNTGDAVRFVNFGSADGCPTGHVPSSTECGTSGFPNWGPEDIYQLSWGLNAAWPLPEIYNDSMDDQWYWLTVYGKNKYGSTMRHVGPMTQDGATTSTTFSPSTGYTKLYNSLNRSGSTVGQTPEAVTDIRW